MKPGSINFIVQNVQLCLVYLTDCISLCSSNDKIVIVTYYDASYTKTFVYSTANINYLFSQYDFAKEKLYF